MVHLCGYTYVEEGVPNEQHGYDGSPLLRCSQCKLQFYMNKAAQKAHWKLHKRSCKATMAAGGFTTTTEDDRQNWDSTTLDGCMVALKSSLVHPQNQLKGQPELPRIIQKIRSLMDEGASDTGDIAFELHTFCRGLIFQQQNLLLHAMAKPGMVSLMMTNDIEDLLSEKNRFLRQHNLQSKFNGRPTEEYIRDYLADDDRAEQKRVQEACEKFDELDDDGGWYQPSSMSFCYLYYNLLIAAAVIGPPSMSSIHDGQGSFRGMEDPTSADFFLTTAAIRRALSLWSDPLVLDSTGDAMAPAAGLAHKAILRYNSNRDDDCVLSSFLQKNEVAPGLDVDNAICTSLQELGQQAASAHYSEGVIHVVACFSRPKPTKRIHNFWNDLPTDRRAKVALAIVHYIIEDDRTYKSDYGPNRTADLQDLNILFRTACGLAAKNSTDTNDPTTDDDYDAEAEVGVPTPEAVWTKAALEGETLSPEPAGHNAEIRAFFYYLLRRWELEGSLPVQDLKQEIDSFLEVPPGTTEKEECKELAYGKRLYAERKAYV